MLVPEPDIPLVEVMFTPGTLPCKTRATSASGRFSSCELSTEVTA